MPRYALMTSPLTLAEIKAQTKKSRRVKGVVIIDLIEIVEATFNLGEDGFLDLLSRRLIGSDLLSDSSYKIVGFKGDELHILMRGDARLHIECVLEE